MLAQATAQFPYPGSIALLDGLSYTVQRINADRTVTLSRQGTGASFRRDAPIDQLVDPADAERHAALTLAGAGSRDAGRADAAIALFVAAHLRDANATGLYDVRRAVAAAARIGRCPDVRDHAHLARILRHLGWTKSGMTGAPLGRQPRYVRGEG